MYLIMYFMYTLIHVMYSPPLYPYNYIFLFLPSFKIKTNKNLKKEEQK